MSTDRAVLEDARLTLQSLLSRILTGPDPFDGLGARQRESRGAVVKLLRQARLQLVRRSPFDPRRFLGIKPFRMVKTVAQVLVGAVRLRDQIPDGATLTQGLAEELAARAMRSEGRSWWGYEFDVQTRWGFSSAQSPNLIVTRFASEALLEAENAGIRVDESLLAGVSRLLRDLESKDDQGPFIKYLPHSDVRIYNAASLGAGLAVRLGARLGESEASALGLRVADGVASAGRVGAWPYGRGPRLEWKDSFHTAYTLIGLREAGMNAPAAEAELDALCADDAGHTRYYLSPDSRKGDAHTFGTLLWWYGPGETSLRLWEAERQRLSWHDQTGLRWGNGYPRWDESHVVRGLAEIVGEG